MKALLVRVGVDQAYVLDAWGGLSVKDGFIQCSAVPPSFLNAARLYMWLQRHDIPLLARNN